MSDPKQDDKKPRALEVKMPEEIARGAYANAMAVFHGREEFVLDFLNVFPVPPGGIVTARIITSPGHIKRIIKALRENLQRYEARFGPVQEAAPPYSGPMGYA